MKKKRTSKAAIEVSLPKELVETTLKSTCHDCGAGLKPDDSVFFVEEVVGRVFCSEECINEYFKPDVEALDADYQDHRPDDDLDNQESDELGSFRWPNLQNPDEVWMQKTVAGDHRFCFISQYELNGKKVWSVCVCLILGGEPSFLFLAFVTKYRELADHFGRGERVELPMIVEEPEAAEGDDFLASSASEIDEKQFDRLSESWSDFEIHLAEARQMRKPTDIPESDFEEYEPCFEKVLEDPDEVWMIMDDDDLEKSAIFHFIKRFSSYKPAVYYIVVAQEGDSEDELEVIDTFPTNDHALVEHYRKGTLEISPEDEGGESGEGRVVH